MAEPKAYVLDSSALLALRSDEPGADRVEGLFRATGRGGVLLYASFMSRMEVSYRVAAEEGEETAADAIRLLDATSLRWVSCEAAILEEAARLKARGGISVADAWIAATARHLGATLVHKDPEFAGVEDLLQEDLVASRRPRSRPTR